MSLASGAARKHASSRVLDNLGKGASGAAVQNLNLMCGLDETAGLRLTRLRACCLKFRHSHWIRALGNRPQIRCQVCYPRNALAR